jgi:DNA-binding response OmpR family regulator
VKDALISERVYTMLTDEGWAVETVVDGATALERLQSDARYDVLIFDNELPDTEGVELIRKARRLAHRHQTPIIVLSEDDVEMQARRAGANAFLQKPAGIPLVSETITRLLTRRKGNEI